LSFSILEALAMARPCLLTPAADPSGLAGKHGAAVVVEPTVEVISKALRILAEKPKLELEEMGQRGRALVESQFIWERTAQMLIDAYQKHKKE
jgi:glycosyltransferase involved in cell wall biosynthesis